MLEYLFCMIGTAVAETAVERRPGARHALMIWATSPTAEDAVKRGAEFAGQEGWILV